MGEGEIFSCDLVDDTGSINFIGFNAFALMLADKIQQDQVIVIYLWLIH